MTLLTRLAARKPGQAGVLAGLFASRLVRLAPVAIAVARETGDPIGQVLAEGLNQTPDTKLAARLELLVMEDAVALREVALAVTRQLLDAEPAHEWGERKVFLLNNMAINLLRLGKPKEALDFAAQAATGFRHLGQSRPRTGVALISLGYAYKELGRHQEAAEAASEAVRHFSALVEQGEPAFQPDLAVALHNWAGSLGDLGAWSQGVDAMRRCIALRRRLEQDDPQAHLPDLAHSLIVQGALLSESGQHGQSLHATEEAVALYRSLREDRPGAYAPELATALANLAAELSDLLRHEEAYPLVCEAVALRRELAQARPDAFVPALLAAINQKAAILAAAENPNALAEAAEEAVSVARRLAAENSPAYTETLARALGNLARAHSENRQQGLAVDAARESLSLRRRLAADGRLPALGDLARELNNLSQYLSLADLDEEALAVAGEAVRLYESLNEQALQTYGPYLAVAWNTLARRQNGIGHIAQAQQSNRTALAILHPSVAAEPGAYGAWAESFRQDAELFAGKLATVADKPPG